MRDELLKKYETLRGVLGSGGAVARAAEIVMAVLP